MSTLLLASGLACQAPPPPPATVGSTGTSTPPISPPPTTGDTGEPPVPMIGEALGDRCANALNGEPLPVGSSLRAVTLHGAGRCNDGSAPRLYVRAATDPAHAADWVWLFDGGSFCGNYEECAIRWCGEHYPYGQRHMSSNPLPMGIGGTGITSKLVENTFAGWNQVFAAYCTSDLWTGTHSDVVFDGDPPYRLHFEGARVGADGVAAGVAGLQSDDGLETLPPLSAAETLVIVGTSAGCGGATSHNAELVAAAPGADVTTVLDSCFAANRDVMDPKLAAASAAQGERFWDEIASSAWASQLDPTCLADHPTDPVRCSSTDEMARSYLSRVVIDHDLSDSVVYDIFGELGLSMAEYADLAIATFRSYEGAEPQISVHGNNCGWHTAVDSDGSFLNWTVVDTEHGGPAVAEQDVLVRALAHETTIAVDSSPSTTSYCGG